MDWKEPFSRNDLTKRENGEQALRENQSAAFIGCGFFISFERNAKEEFVMHRVVVWGASGLAGGELLRLLAGHPSFEPVGAVSRKRAGQPIWHVHPHLRSSLPELAFMSPEEALGLDVELAFLALPHGTSGSVIESYRSRGVRVVDLSADVRLRDASAAQRWYGAPLVGEGLRSEAVYGLPELHREELRGASLASGVGCNATAANLALFPLARAGVLQEARLECRVGSSEAGSSPSEGSHHPFRSRALRIVEPFRHRHLAEVSQELDMAEDALSMTVTAAEMVRGVQMMARVTFREPLREADLWKIYRKAFRGEPFLSLCPARPKHLRFPDPRLVLGSNQVLVGFALEADGRTGIVVSAIDNLMKGASGTAIQAANLMMGLEETQGLEMLPTYPA